MEYQTQKPATFNVKQAAEFLGISRRHLSRLTTAGDVPVIRLGKWPRYSRAVLEKIANEGTTCVAE